MEPSHFDINKREYVLNGMFSERPLQNVLFNDKTVARLNQFGFGNSEVLTPQGFRPLLFEERLVYVKDENNGVSYAANRNYDQLPFEDFSCHVGIGYQRIVSLYQGLEVICTFLVPHDGYVELSHIEIINHSNKRRKISLYSLVKPHVNVTWHSCYTKPSFDETHNAVLFSHMGYDVATPYVHSFYKSDFPISSFELSERFFKGFYSDFANPIGLKRPYLGNRIVTFEDRLLAVLQFRFSLEAGETKNVNLAYGLASSESEMATMMERYGEEDNYIKEMSILSKEQDDIEESCQIKTPDSYLDVMINTWLKRQISLGKTWGRIYGKGFRDGLQDVSSFVSFDPAAARKKILSIPSYMKKDGNALRQFDPVFDYPYRDGPAWIPMALLSYLNESGDLSILDETIGYYDDKTTDSVFSHLCKGMDFLLSGVGEHGLCLWGGGDWNDSMNACGLQGKGESLWLSLATLKAMNDFKEIVRISKPSFDYSSFDNKARSIREAVRKWGFDKDHFIYGYDDEGETVGSFAHPEYGTYYLNPQTWAVLADVVDEKEGDELLNVVEKKLRCPFGYVLMDHPFTKGSDKIGRVSYFYPGCFENGSVYIHANAFKIAADLRLRRADEAYQSLLLIRYNNPKNLSSGVEPYAVSNMYLGPSSGVLSGYAPQSWITGSAGWLYRDVVEMLLGVKADYGGLHINPCLPSGWKETQVKRRFRGAFYNIKIIHDGRKAVFVDDKEIKGSLCPMIEEGKTAFVEYHY